VGVERRVFRFSVMTSGAPDATSWRKLVGRVDAEGYDVVHMPQHRGTKGFSPLIALAFVASHSSRLRIGTLVLDNESVHPAIVARDAATLDMLSGGRLELGIGAGWLEADHAAIGQDFAPAGTRIDRLSEAIDVLRATFPAGTVSGAPKVRAMEIIDELEPVKRCIYAGAVGYLGFHGNMDVAIALRTAVVKDGRLHVQAGGGVVADSQPEAEWQETQNKARALLRAAEMAEAGLDTRLD